MFSMLTCSDDDSGNRPVLVVSGLYDARTRVEGVSGVVVIVVQDARIMWVR